MRGGEFFFGPQNAHKSDNTRMARLRFNYEGGAFIHSHGHSLYVPWKVAHVLILKARVCRKQWKGKEYFEFVRV